MAYRELHMIDVREILRRVVHPHSARRVAAAVGIDRKTVARYAEAAAAAGVTRDTPLTDEVVHDVARRVQQRPTAEPSDEWCEVAAHRERIEAWLARSRPLRLRRIHTLLTRDHGLRASYDTLRRYAQRELGWRKRPTSVRVDDGEPGREAQVDFGLMATISDPRDGSVRRLYALIVTLVVSRYMFVWPTFTQTTEAVCEGLDQAWRFFGAMAKSLVPDNMSAIVSRADAVKPTFVPAFVDYLQARDIEADPARVRRPKDKARVENQVPFVRESCFDGETFLSLVDAREHAERWCRDVAGARVHGTTRRVPREAFETDERPHMHAAPTAPFDVPMWTTAKVQPDQHIQVAHALYSVPLRHVGVSVRVRADQTTVRIYVGTEPIKTHPRVAPGKRSTDPADLPEHVADYAMRSIDGVRSKAQKRGEYIGRYAARLLDGPMAWRRMREVHALLRLCERHGDGRVEAICQSALAFDVVDVRRIERMLTEAIKPGTPEVASGKVVPLPTPRFARAAEHFETRPTARDTEGS